MKTITDIFKNKNSQLSKLIDESKNSKNLEIVFHAALDPNLAKHCTLANYKDSLLTITVPNISWATRLRYSIPDIIKNLKVQPEFKEITKIRYTVALPKKQIAKKIPKSIKISKNNDLLWKKTLDDLKRRESK